MLDRDIPGVHGDQICRSLVAEGRDGRDPDADRGRARSKTGSTVSGLGADDYLPKPFALRRARRSRARARAALGARSCRRCSRMGDLRVDPANRLATRDGATRLALSPKGLRRAQAPARRQAGRIVSAEELLEGTVWDENAEPFTTTVKVTDPASAREARGAAADRDGRPAPATGSEAEVALSDRLIRLASAAAP